MDDMIEIRTAIDKIAFIVTCLYDIQDDIHEAKPKENLGIVIEILSDYILTTKKEIDIFSKKYENI